MWSAPPSYPHTVRCGPGLTASGVRQARALVRCGVNRGSGTELHEAENARMRLHADVQNRLAGNTESLRDGMTDLQKVTKAYSRQSSNPRKNKGADTQFRIREKPRKRAGEPPHMVGEDPGMSYL